MREMRRYEVPVYGRTHAFVLTGPVYAVAARDINTVEFWSEWNMTVPSYAAKFIVYGTRQEIARNAVYAGTCQRISGLI